MKLYLFSIFVRGAVALSGFFVFLVSSKIFGADGRGVMSYGTSIFASIGLIVSLNLGRGFIVKTERTHVLKKEHLFSYFIMNLILTFCTAIFGVLFWQFSESAHKIIDLTTLISLVLLSIVYVWSVNGNSFFAAFQNTRRQEFVILGTRVALIIFLGLCFLFPPKELWVFLTAYSSILSLGVVCEWSLLLKSIHWPQKMDLKKSFRSTLTSSFWPHIDFLAFNLFPLALILIAGLSMTTTGLGRINFAIQIVNLVFLLSTTANIRVNTYISNFGYEAKMAQIKKLVAGTIVLSVIAIVVAIPSLRILTGINSFRSFEGVENLFTIALFAIPGFMSYQFLSPLWLESGLIKKSVLLNMANTLIACLIAPFLIDKYSEQGALYSFVWFHLGCLVVQILLYFVYKNSDSYVKKNSKNHKEVEA